MRKRRKSRVGISREETLRKESISSIGLIKDNPVDIHDVGDHE